MRYRNVIFDMDGVLIDNSAGIISCARETVKALGLRDLSDDEYKLFIGPALMWSLKAYAGATEEESERGYEIYRKLYFGRGINEYVVYDGVEDALKELIAAGVKCSVASGKPAESVRRILATSGLGKYFVRAEGCEKPKKDSDKVRQLRLALADEPAVMVGDRIFDIEAAEAVGIDCIYAEYGFCVPGETDGRRPAFYAKTPRDIADIVLCRGKYA